MNSIQAQAILQQARLVRRWACRRAGNRDLTGWCARASAELWYQLTQQGIGARLRLWEDAHTGEGHVFVTVGNHVVDVTATQFNEFQRQTVVFVPWPQVRHHAFYQAQQAFATAEQLRQYQLAQGWPCEQTALPGPVTRGQRAKSLTRSKVAVTFST